ncbi:MAG TPA: phage tail protein [Egicoccus sp.]|nr:phage tail protein [Egicoccus sp.]HSK21536.1 phage tail protein [Egicoccus sp.]
MSVGKVEQRLRPTPEYPPGWLVGQLPVGMRDDDLLVRFTTIFERLGETLRAGADGIEFAANPTVTSPDMLIYMGRWLGYDVLDPELGTEHQRRVVAALGRALRLRGTAAGLRILLEAVTGAPVEIDEPGRVVGDEDAGEITGVVRVRVTSSGHLREHELEALVRDEVPAHLHVDVEFAPAAAEEAS